MMPTTAKDALGSFGLRGFLLESGASASRSSSVLTFRATGHHKEDRHRVHPSGIILVD